MTGVKTLDGKVTRIDADAIEALS